MSTAREVAPLMDLQLAGEGNGSSRRPGREEDCWCCCSSRRRSSPPPRTAGGGARSGIPAGIPRHQCDVAHPPERSGRRKTRRLGREYGEAGRPRGPAGSQERRALPGRRQDDQRPGVLGTGSAGEAARRPGDPGHHLPVRFSRSRRRRHLEGLCLLGSPGCPVVQDRDALSRQPAGHRLRSDERAFSGPERGDGPRPDADQTRHLVLSREVAGHPPRLLRAHGAGRHVHQRDRVRTSWSSSKASGRGDIRTISPGCGRSACTTSSTPSTCTYRTRSPTPARKGPQTGRTTAAKPGAVLKAMDPVAALQRNTTRGSMSENWG